MVDRTPEIATLLRQKPAAEGPIQGIGRHNATKAALDVLRALADRRSQKRGFLLLRRYLCAGTAVLRVSSLGSHIMRRRNESNRGQAQDRARPAARCGRTSRFAEAARCIRRSPAFRAGRAAGRPPRPCTPGAFAALAGGSIGRQRPATRRCGAVWGLLRLPTCGVVWCAKTA
jgi:hypothetical protein